MAKDTAIVVPDDIKAARKSLTGLRANRQRYVPLLTSTEAKYRDPAKVKIADYDKRMAAIFEKFPELNGSTAAKKAVRDELTGKIEVDRALVLERLQSIDELILEQVVRIFSNHATRKGLDAVSELLSTVGKPEDAPQEEGAEEGAGQEEGQDDPATVVGKPKGEVEAVAEPSTLGNEEAPRGEPQTPVPDVKAELKEDAAFHRRTGRRQRATA